MAGKLIGADELKARFKEMRLVFKPMGKDWADTTARLAARSSPRRTGKLAASFKRREASQRRAVVSAMWYGKFPNRGVKPHPIKAKKRTLIFDVGGRTIFAKAVKHRGNRAQRFIDRAAYEGLRRHVNKEALIDAWNRGA